MITNRDLPKIVTPWKHYTDEHGDHRIRARYGWSKHGDQDPYFSITAEEQSFMPASENRTAGRWGGGSVGMMSGEIAKHLPHLAHLLPFHLFSLTGGPMHYRENALYWWEVVVGLREHPVITSGVDGEALLNIIGFGVLPEDLDDDGEPKAGVLGTFKTIFEASDTPNNGRAWFQVWLNQRFPKILRAFHETMQKANLLTPTGAIIVPPSPEPEKSEMDKFAERHGIRFKSDFVTWDGDMQKYKCVFRRGRRSMTIPFFLGAAHDEPPTINEVLSHVVREIDDITNAGDFETWARDLGYNDDSRKAKSWYDQIVSQEERLQRVLGNDVFDELMTSVDRLE